MASWRPQNLNFLKIFFPLYRNYVENAGKKSRKCEKILPIPHLKAHPGGGQETKLFLRVAPDISDTST